MPAPVRLPVTVGRPDLDPGEGTGLGPFATEEPDKKDLVVNPEQPGTGASPRPVKYPAEPAKPRPAPTPTPPSPQEQGEQQEPPFAIQVELVEGCNLRCNFCGLSGIRGADNNFKFMSIALAQKIVADVSRLKWNPRIEFAMHGEPTMNPDLLGILETFRRGLPRHHIMMTSNGGGLVKDPTTLVDGVLRFVNVLALDWYENVQIVPKILERYTGVHTPRYYPQDRDANPHARRGPAERLLVVIQDIAKAETGNHSLLNNHAGSGGPPNDRMTGRRCAKPFRELSIRWDGGVAICCNDWPGRYVCGDARWQGLDAIWNSPPFQAARRKLYRGERDFGPCKGCDAVSYRVGLLPDKKGRLALPLATQADYAVIATALECGPLTQPVPRPWDASALVAAPPVAGGVALGGPRPAPRPRPRPTPAGG